MGNCMRLILDFGLRPAPRDLVHVANDRIVSVHSDVLHGDRLLSSSTVPIEPLRRHRKCALGLVGKLKVSTPGLWNLVRSVSSTRA